MTFRYSLLTGICFLLAFPIYVQGQADTLQITSLNESIAIAMRQNPDEAVYQAQIKQAINNYKAAKGFLYPNASGNFNGTDNLHLGITPVPGELIGKPGITYYAQFGKQYVYNAGISLSQTIFNWSVILQTKIANGNVALSNSQHAAYQQSLKEQVAGLYYAALVAQAALQISQSDWLLADTLQMLAAQRLKEGATDILSVNQSVINKNNIEQNQAQSQQLYNQSIENMKILLGEKAGTFIVLSEKLSTNTIDMVTVTTLHTDESLDVYEQQAHVAEIQSRAQRSAAYPTISAIGYLGQQQFRDDFGLSFSNGAWNAYRYLGLNITVPLFTGFANSNKYKSAKVQYSIAAMEYENARRQSEIKDQLLLKNYTDYLSMSESAANNFKLFGDNLRLNQQKYQEGIIGLDIYLKAFQDYLAAENNYLNSLSQLFSTQATIKSRQ